MKNKDQILEFSDDIDTGQVRVYDIEAISLPIVYNKYGDHDPNGLLYVLKQDSERIQRKAKELFAKPAPQPYEEVRPLVIRANVGETVAPRESIQYLWHADRECGACQLTSFGDLRNHRHHGLFGAVMIEPFGSTYYNGIRTVTENDKEEAVITAPGVEPFRFRARSALAMCSTLSRNAQSALGTICIAPVPCVGILSRGCGGFSAY